MKKIVLLLASAVLTAGCATDFLEESDVATTRADAGKAMSEIRERSLEGAVYNEVTDAWMIPQPDSYALENVQKAYDNLASKRSTLTQNLSKAQAAEFTVAKKLEPTHYALKIYPRDEEEQWEVESMEDVQVAYIPFDWVQLTQEEIERLPQTMTKSLGTASAKAFTFPEKSPYTVTYDYTDVTDGGPTGPVTYQLPILYVVWPVSKPFPADLEYVVDYEVFLPRAANQTNSVEALSSLENEAIALALGLKTIQKSPATRAAAAVVVSGTITDWDNTLWRDVPMSNLKIRIQLGSNSYQTSTNASGFFSISVPSIPTGSHRLYPVFQDTEGRWKITTENSTAPFSGPGNLLPSPRFQYEYLFFIEPPPCS